MHVHDRARAIDDRDIMMIVHACECMRIMIMIMMHAHCRDRKRAIPSRGERATAIERVSCSSVLGR